MYDIRAPLVSGVDTKMPYDEAKKKLVEGLAPLGDTYLADLKMGIESGWIDVYENEGKKSGAYSWGTFGCHPYVLLNYENTLDSLFTFAHEMGHAMHSFYTWNTQPNVYSEYTMFSAEVASTVNETLLIEHMLKTTRDQKTRAYLLSIYLEQFHGTLLRQTLLAEFELTIHNMARDGEPLTVESLSKVYRDLNLIYYGPDMEIDKQIDIGWARIPHFFRTFYVYQYATGYSAAIALTKRLQTGGTDALEDYLGFLKAGSSDSTINLLRNAGVDMSTPMPVRDALCVFDGLVSELDMLI